MVTRAIHLIDASRYDLAETELRKALAQDPEDFYAHAYMGFCQYHLDNHDQALMSAQKAITLLPDHPFGHYVSGLIKLHLDNYKEAKSSFQEAIRLNPSEAEFHGILGRLYLETEQYASGLEHANKGLALDPQNMTCKNCRAGALTRLGRMDEAQRTIEGALKDDPENDHTFANLGWTCLHQGQHKKALEHFKEALRLNPDNEMARNGMINALKAKFLIYKLLLMFYLWMSRLNPKVRTGIIVGAVVLMRVLRTATRQVPDLKPFIAPVIFLYLGFVYLTWTGNHFFNTMLRFNKFGRCVLNARERRASNCYACLILAGIISLVTAVVLEQQPLLYLGGYFFLMTIPFCHLFDKSKDKLNHTILLFCIGLTALGIVGIALSVLGRQGAAGGFGGLFFLVFIIFMWTGALSGNKSKAV